MSFQLPTHFFANGSVCIGFDVTTCETCGRPVREGSINLHENPARLLSLGLVQVDTLPAEADWNIEAHDTTCDRVDCLTY